MRKLRRIVLILAAAALLTGCGRYDYKEGVECLENGEYEKAVQKFEKAAAQEYNAGDSYCGIAAAKWEKEDYEGAVEAFEKAFENGCEATGAIYSMLGTCRMKTGDYKGAVTAYEKGILEEDCTEEMIREMKFNAIAACENMGDWETAKQKLAEYVKQYPDDEEAAKEAEFFSTR